MIVLTRPLAAGAIATLLAVGTQANDVQRRGPIVSFIRGECQSLVVANRASTRFCRPELIGIFYPSDDISFVFAMGGGRLVSFKGRPGHAQGSQTTLKVGQVTVVSGMHARSTAVVGSCVFTGVSTGRNQLQCDVVNQGVRYSAAFMTGADIPARLALSK